MVLPACTNASLAHHDFDILSYNRSDRGNGIVRKVREIGQSKLWSAGKSLDQPDRFADDVPQERAPVSGRAALRQIAGRTICPLSGLRGWLRRSVCQLFAAPDQRTGIVVGGTRARNERN